jgi:predicted nucleic acid-binding protein
VQHRRLVIDANILIRAVLGRQIKVTLAKHGNEMDFFAPEVAFEDAERHLPAVLTKFNRSAEIEAALSLLNQLRGIVTSVPHDAYLLIKDDALARILRDPDDWHVLAVAMLLDCPIWTEDNDFFGTGVPTWTTDRVEIYLAPPNGSS